MDYPPFLAQGDTIGITSTARKISKQELQFAIDYLEALGYKVKLSSCIGQSDRQFAGTDEERAGAFDSLVQDPEVKAVLCGRGGYGSVRIVDQIDWQAFQETPKWLCGYSDVTVLHSRLNHLGIASLHSTMPINFETNTKDALHSLTSALIGKTLSLKAEKHKLNRAGNSLGAVVGGNLSILYSLLGSKDQLDTRGKILVLEDLDEYLYHVDRMMQALKRAGMLSNLAGLVIGGMSDMNDNTIGFGKTAKEIIHEAVADFSYPVAFDLPFGHVDDNQTLMLGAEYKLSVGENSVLEMQS